MKNLAKATTARIAWYAMLAALTFAAMGALTNAHALPEKVMSAGAYKVRVVTLVKGLEEPWSVAFLPDGRMLVTERPGRLRIVKDGRLLPQPVTGLPAIHEQGQGGLLDVALHPRFAENGWVYLSYAAKGEGGIGTEVFRGRLAGAQLLDGKVIFRMVPKLSASHHFGSRLVFDRAGLLYITLGDRGDQERAQKLDQHPGKIVRLNDDGSIPEDNPFVGQAGIRPEIFTLGHRNVQGAAVHPITGLVWTHEHGPQGGDEVNVLRPGVNYGWPVITYGVNYIIGTKIGEGTEKAGMAQPLYKWVPSIAPSGMAFYNGDAFPKWRGSLFVGSLKFNTLVRLQLEGEKVVGEERLLVDIGRLRDVREGPQGLLYLLTQDSLLRLEPMR